MVHEGGWQLVKGDAENYVTIPPRFEFSGQLARGPNATAVA